MNRLNQPDFLPLHRWPTLHLNGPRGRSPFLNPDSASIGSSPCTHTLTRNLSDSLDEVVVLGEDTVKEEEDDTEKKISVIAHSGEEDKAAKNLIELREGETEKESVNIRRGIKQDTVKVENETKENIAKAGNTDVKYKNSEKEKCFSDKKNNEESKVISTNRSVDSVKKKVAFTDKNFDDFVC